MAVYIIAQLDIHDREEYSKYEDKFMDVFDRFEGKLLSVDEAPTVLEGEWSATRSVLIEFPSREDALAWMTSDAYRAISKHRTDASVARSIMVASLDSKS